jgi:hypothetical protein
MTLFEKALVLHLVGDWLLQNDWMARNKFRLSHPVLGWAGGLVLGIVHLLIDTRVPLQWWSRIFRQTTTGEMGTHVAIWCDQILHVATIAVWIGYGAQWVL